MGRLNIAPFDQLIQEVKGVFFMFQRRTRELFFTDGHDLRSDIGISIFNEFVRM